MLSQKMTKELLFTAVMPQSSANLEHAEQTVKLFNDTLYSLRDGNTELGLPATTDPRILRQIGKVDELWIQYRTVVEGIIASRSIAESDVAAIAKLNLPLLKEMNKCVTLYERQASGASMQGNPALAVAVNLSGKQRMLSQKMTKELLLITYGFDTETNMLLLTETYSLFDRTLTGLERGDDLLELSAAVNTPEILQQLEVVKSVWAKYLPVVKSAADGEEISAERLVLIQKLNMTLLKEMNKAVGMYAELAS